MTAAFDRYVAIDWSGGQGMRHRGIAIAVCDSGSGAPVIIAPPDGKAWSRAQVFDWLLTVEPGALVGFDFSFALPFVDLGAYLPGCNLGRDPQALWDSIDRVCAADIDFYGGRFAAEFPFADHFRRTGAAGVHFTYRRRVTEIVCRECGLGRAESMFHLIGPNQVGLASLSGMRLLRALSSHGRFAIWPFADPRPGTVTLVELYTRLFLLRAGCGHKKVRDGARLRAALAALNSESGHFPADLSDHETDVLISAAGMRHSHETATPDQRHALWHPAALSDKVRSTEGWTWGVP